MEKITRTIATSVIHSAKVVYDTTTKEITKSDLPDVTEHGEITAEKAEKIVSKKHNLKGVPFVITGIDVTAGTYECTLDEFLSVAKPVEPKAAPVAESADKQ